ncbi:major facilitator superfamily domain-containing protein, partial [Cyathus striatus]
FPEGGRRAWLVVLGVWIFQFCTFGYMNAYGAYNDYYIRTYMAEKYTSSQVSWIGSVQLLLAMSSGLISGRAFDIGYFYHMMIGGSSLFIFCLLMLSITQAEHYYQECQLDHGVFLTQGLGMGISIGIMYVPGVAVVSQYFLRRRALAIGITATGAGMGGALHPIMLNELFHGTLGFHNGVRASAALNAGLLFIALLLVKPRLLPTSKKASNTLDHLLTFAKDLPYLFTIVGTTFVLAGLYYPIFFLQLKAVKNGINESLAFYTIAIMNASSIIGRVIPNLFAHRLGVFNVLIGCISICGILIFCTFAVHDISGTMAFALLYGFFSGGYASLLSPLVASLAKSDSEIGARMGICFTFTGTPIAGALLTSTYIWWRPIVFAGLCVVFGSVCFCVTRFLRSRQLNTQWI